MNRPGLSEEFQNCKADQIIEFTQKLLDLDKQKTKIAIHTGFYIKDAKINPAPETDGPSSCLMLASVLFQLQFKQVTLYVDKINLQFFEKLIQQTSEKYAELKQLQLSCNIQASYQSDVQIFIEKSGRNKDNKCLSMRAVDITQFTDNWQVNQNALSLGIGDGGNEIGCGKLLFQNLTPPQIKCQQSTNYTILSDISNLGGILLSYSIALISNQLNNIQFMDEQFTLKEDIKCGFVDGVTGVAQESIDNMKAEQYYQICQILLK